MESPIYFISISCFILISGHMREYLMKKWKDVAEIEAELKNRNRYIFNKIQDICCKGSRNKFFLSALLCLFFCMNEKLK